MKLYRFLRQSAVLFMALLIFSSFGTTVFAYETVDIGRETSLSVYFGKDGIGFSGVEFRVYRVAEVSETVQFTLTGDFTDYPVTVNNLDSSGWRALAQTLDGYVARDGLAYLQAAGTGTDGYAKFSALPAGLYLVVGDRFREDSLTYTPEPFLICLPNMDSEADAWDYDPTVFCKYDSSSEGGEDGTVTRKVLKVWKDDGKEEERPEEIVVQLLLDDMVYDTVTLNEKNNWRYTWSGLNGDYQWRVTECETPEGYTVSVNRESITFVMTNTRTEESPDPGTSDNPNLPQTGMLWWPVPLLTCCGLFLLLVGWGVKHRERE